MALFTAFTELFSVRHPIALAPMGGAAGGALAAAVSSGGGLGLLGGGNGDADWLARELPIVARGAGEPWGVGFQSWAIDVRTIERALEWRPRAVMLSFGDPRPFTDPVRRAGAALIIQATSVDEARQAVDLGADVIVAQGTESGGHGARRGRSTLPFVPVVADLAAPVPVLAAGGIADGRGVAAALALGAAGVLLGTRFLATAEALTDPPAIKAIIDGHGADTERSSVLDIARGSRWPREYTGRTLGHPFLDQWRDREDELAADPAARQAYQDGIARGDLPPEPVWASEAIDLITDLPSAADLVAILAAQAEDALAWAGKRRMELWLTSAVPGSSRPGTVSRSAASLRTERRSWSPAVPRTGGGTSCCTGCIAVPAGRATGRGPRRAARASRVRTYPRARRANCARRPACPPRRGRSSPKTSAGRCSPWRCPGGRRPSRTAKNTTGSSGSASIRRGGAAARRAWPRPS